MTSNTNPKHILAFDIGTGTCQLAVVKNGKPSVLKFAGETSFPSCVCQDDKGKTSVGAKAARRAYKNPERFYSNFKPAMKLEEVAALSKDGNFTVIDGFAALMKYLIGIAKQAMPALAGYPQLGGSKLSGSDLLVVITMPANEFGFTQSNRYKQAAILAGFPEDLVEHIAFFKEPYAAAHAALSGQNLCNLMPGDLIAVIDLGDGTLDVAIAELKDNQLHARAAHSGVSDLGGSNFTAAVAEAIGNKLSIPFVCFTRGKGLSFFHGELEANEREEQFSIWEAAIDAKHQLSLEDSAYVTVATTDGTKEVELEESDLGAEWTALLDEVESTVADALSGSGLDWPKVKWVVAAGGGSRTRGMHDIMARATGRPVSEVHYCDEPQHAIVEGAVIMAQGIEDVTISVNDTWGFTYPHVISGKNVNEVYIEAGRLMPPEGIDESKITTKVISTGKPQRLELHPFIAKQTVLANPGDHLSDSEVIWLATVQAELDLPAGEHAVCVRLRTDSTQKWVVVLSFPDMPEREAIVTSLRIDKDESGPSFIAEMPVVVVLFDSSYSMLGAEIAEARDSTCGFLKKQMAQGIECAVVDFGGEPSLCIALTTDSESATAKVRSLAAGDGTSMAKGLSMVSDMCGDDRELIAVMFSDGYPQSEENTITAAAKLRKQAELYTIAIGEAADVSLLKSIASSPDHFFPIGRSSDLSLVFDSIATLIYTGGNQQLSVPTKVA